MEAKMYRFDRIKIFSLLAILLVLSSMLVGCSSEKTVKIGFVAQLTGASSYVGQASKLALEDRVKELNEKGGIKGYKVELIVLDSQSEVPQVVAAAKRLMEQDKVVGIIGPEWSGAAIPLAPISASSKVPVIATTASNVKVTVDDNGKVNPYMFRVCFIDPYQGKVLADYAFNELGKKKVAFIADVSSPYSMGIQSFFTDHFTALGGEVVAKEGYQGGDTEFRAQLSKVSESGADLLVVPTDNYRDIALVAKQADALGIKIQFLGGDGWFADELLDMAGKELEGAFFTSGVSTDAPEFAEYNAAFFQKHNIQPNFTVYYSLDAFYAYEYAIAQAIEKTGKPDPVAVRDALETMKDVQLFSSKMTMEADTHNPHNKPASVMGIKDSKWILAKTYQPQD